MKDIISQISNMPATGMLYYALSFLTLICAMMVVLARNPIHSVLFLIATFFCLSGHYVLLNAQFLAAVNIIVYAGAIMVLFLFVIMFLNLKTEEEDNSKNNIMKIAATIVGGTLGVIIVAALKKSATGTYNPYSFNSQTGMVENLGQVLFRDYILPFELASVLFLVAMVGAVMLGKRETGDRHF